MQWFARLTLSLAFSFLFIFSLQALADFYTPERDFNWGLHALTRPFGLEMYDAPADVHFSKQGNAKLAAQVAAAIRKHGLK
ncbi:MAG: hypothetical protein ACNA77_05140 [Opitutales bacterium]